jgi:putative component of membrane protein insertase Oxa1/YidC/SpoIIIJ protein YidD
VLTDQKAKATAVTRVLSFTTDCREVAAFLAECEGLAGQGVAAPREAAPTYLAPAIPRRLPDHDYPYAVAYDTVPRAARAPAKAIGPAGIPAYAWRGFVSRVDGARCPHYPTCSQYCLLSIKQHGLFGGLARTAARLLGEYGAIETDGRKPFVLVYDRWRLFDPPQAEPQTEKE